MIRYKHFLGPSIPISVARVTYQRKTPLLHVFFLLFAITSALFHPSDQVASASIPLQVLFWLIGYGTFFLAYKLVMIGSIRFAIARGWHTIYASGPLQFTNLIVTVMMYLFMRLVGIATDDVADLVGLVLFNTVLFELGSFCYIAYADRSIYPEVYASTPQPSGAAPAREIFLRGSTLPVHSVEYISAQGNGVVATASGERQFVARPFGLVVSELPVDLGFQIHRSVWVSRTVGLNFVSEGKKQFINLPDGRRFPVARSRQRDYRNWLALAQKHNPRSVATSASAQGPRSGFPSSG